MDRMLLLRGACALLALALHAGSALGADPLHAVVPVTGIVTDTAGRPLANARVVITGANRVAMTGSTGEFNFRTVPAGTYHLDVSLPGYAPAHQELRVPATGADIFIRIALTPSPLTLEGVIVTGSPGGSDPLTVTQSTMQMSGREFDRHVSATIAETLSDEPGISTRYSGPAAALPVIRGLTGDRVLMLQNGQRTGDLSGSSADHALSVDPLSATRIEVVRGPASLLYGSNALGGVVNVIGGDIPSSVPARIDGYVAAQGVSVTPGGAFTGEATVPLGPSLALAIRGGGRDVGDVNTGGGRVLAGTSLTNYNAGVGVGYIGERLTGGLGLNAYDFNYGIPSGPPVEDGDLGEEGIRIDGRRFDVHGRTQLSLGEGMFGQVDANGSAQWYTHDEIEPNGEVGTNFRLTTQTLDARATTDIGISRGTIGVSGLGKQYEPTGEEALTPAATSTSGGVFIYQEVSIGGSDRAHSPQLQIGARYDVYGIATDDSEGFGPARERDFNAFSGSVGLNVPLGEQVSIGGSVARAFRAPTVEELFSSGYHPAAASFDIGNPALQPEVNLGGEALIRIESSRFEGLFSAYYNRIDSFIAPNLVGDTLIDTEDGMEVVPLNIYRQADATLRGIEGKIDAVVARTLVVGVRGDVIRGRFTDDAPLPFMPAGHLGGEVRWENAGFGAGADVEHAFSQRDVPELEYAVDAYTLLGLNLSYARTLGGRVHSVTLRADNVFDEVYREATSRIKEFAPNPGRNVTLVYRLLF